MEMQDLVKFTYCPNCGNRSLKSKDVKGCICTKCNFQYYHNPASAVIGIILYDEKIVLARRARDPQKGTLALPGGFVEYGECLEDALVREIKEELNLSVNNCSYFHSSSETYLYQDVVYPITIAYFVVKALDISQIKAGDDVESYVLVPLYDFDFNKLAFESNRVVLKNFQSLWNSKKVVLP